jgi:hypothetical protein
MGVKNVKNKITQKKLIHIYNAQYPIVVSEIMKQKAVNKPEMWVACSFPGLFSGLKKGATLTERCQVQSVRRKIN